MTAHHSRRTGPRPQDGDSYDGRDLGLMRIIAGLNAMGQNAQATHVPAERDRAIRAALAAHSPATDRMALPRWRAAGPRSFSACIVSCLGAAAIVLAGIIGYTRLQGPAPVSAAQVLQRAAHALAQP